VKFLHKGRLGGWTRAWVVATVLWAAPVAVWVVYPYWQLNLTLESVQSRYVRYLFDDLGLAIEKAEGGRLESEVVDRAADTVLGEAGRSIAGFEALAKNLPTLVPRMKRVPFAAPENGTQVRYFVFPVEASDEAISAALATESSRRQLSEWGRTEPIRLDRIIGNGGEPKRHAGVIELETLKLLADYHRAEDQLPRERLQFLFGVLGGWLAPSIVLYALGSAVGWVVRGFRDTE